MRSKAPYRLFISNENFVEDLENPSDIWYNLTLSEVREIEKLLDKLTFPVEPIQKRKLKKTKGIKTEDKPIVEIPYEGYDELIEIMKPEVKCIEHLRDIFKENYKNEDLVIKKEYPYYIGKVIVPSEQVAAIL